MSDWKISNTDATGDEGEHIVPVNLHNWHLKFPEESVKFLKVRAHDSYSDTRVITHIPTGQEFSIYSNRGEVRVRDIKPVQDKNMIIKLAEFLETDV